MEVTVRLVGVELLPDLFGYGECVASYSPTLLVGVFEASTHDLLRARFRETDEQHLYRARTLRYRFDPMVPLINDGVKMRIENTGTK